MIKPNLLPAMALAAALGAAACAGSNDNDALSPVEQNAANATTSSTQAPAAETTTSGYTDTQLRAFLAVNREVGALEQGTTQEQQAEFARQAGEILTRHGLDATTFNAIANQARTDDALSERLAALQIENVSDETLRHFLAAAAEIQPIARGISAESTDAQRQQASQQIGAVLQRHQIDSATYNAIAQRAQTDAALAARINALQGGATSAPQQ
jgi:hypothetical protein